MQISDVRGGGQLGISFVRKLAANFASHSFSCIPMQVAPLLPPTALPWLAAVQADQYYHLLVPLTVPVTIAAITLNWFSMKLFKHNS